jgi:Ca-activated chloride channel homolog
MMENSIQVGTESRSDNFPVLETVKVSATVEELFVEAVVEQEYRNHSTSNIEAVYSFSLPVDSTLLKFEVVQGESVFSGTVVEKSVAEESYEEAITDGNTAIMLEISAQGLYTANIGNLMPGESATVRFSYGQFLRWNGNLVRMMMPATFAPRYGDAVSAGLSEHQIPDHSFVVERSFSFEMNISGVLAQLDIGSPSHDVEVIKAETETIVRTGAAISMDRDLVFEMRSRDGGSASAIQDTDFDQVLVMASFTPEIPDTEKGIRRAIKIVVDCSGSMAGDSIAQAKIAIARILEGIRDDDLFGIVAFGSEPKSIFDELVPMNSSNLQQAAEHVARLDADMGGTEIGTALDLAYELSVKKDLRQDILLITDGEVWDDGAVMERAQSSGHRIFAIGVGSSVAEDFVRKVADCTGGVCELVSPHENMAERIHRHFQRMYSIANEASIIWPEKPKREFPEIISSVFDGDTLHAVAWFDRELDGPVTLKVDLPDGKIKNFTAKTRKLTSDVRNEQTAPADQLPGTLARMTASNYLHSVSDKIEGQELAMKYQLISHWTNYLVIKEREDGEKANELPELRRVAHTVPAGWYGLSSATSKDLIPVMRCAGMEHPDAAASIALIARPSRGSSLLERMTGTGRAKPKASINIGSLRSPETKPKTEYLNQRTKSKADVGKLLTFINDEVHWRSLTIEHLPDLDVPDSVVSELKQLAKCEHDEGMVILALLYLACKSTAGREIDRGKRRQVLSAFKTSGVQKGLLDAVRNILVNDSAPPPSSVSQRTLVDFF